MIRNTSLKHGMAPILRDPEGFLREWRKAARSMSARNARILEEVVLQGRSLADVGREQGVTRESVRQTVGRCVGVLRSGARRNPQGELGHAADAMGELSETAAIESWASRRISRRSKDEVAAMLIRLGAITEDQAHLAPAICSLVERPAEPRTSLGGMADDARSVLFTHPSGLSPRDLRGQLEAWRTPMSTWPRLDFTRSITARLDMIMTSDGRMCLAPDTGAAVPGRVTTAQRLERALRQAGQCRHVRELVELVRREATAEKDPLAPSALVTVQTARGVLSQDPRFRWVGPGTYGLAEWGVGLTACDLLPGQRPSVQREIEHLLDERGSIPMPELMEHLNRRLRVLERTIRSSIQRNPGTEIRKGVLHRVDPEISRLGAGRGLPPIELLTVDEVKRCKRQVDVLRELAVRNRGMADIAAAAKLVEASSMTSNTRRGIASNLHSHVSHSRKWARLGRNRAWLLEFGPPPWKFPA